MSGAIWTDEMIAMLTNLWAEGISTRLIAVELKRLSYQAITKSAVIGKSHRLGLPSRPSPVLRDRPAKPKPTPKLRPSRVPNELREVLQESTPEHIKVLQVLRPHHRRPKSIVEVPMEQSPGYTLEQVQDASGCRWPLGGHKERARAFCGAKQTEGQWYCEYHHQMSRQRATGSLFRAEWLTSVARR